MKWISVKDQVPSKANLYLVCIPISEEHKENGFLPYHLCHWHEADPILAAELNLPIFATGNWCGEANGHKITHWMEIVDPQTKE